MAKGKYNSVAEYEQTMRRCSTDNETEIHMPNTPRRFDSADIGSSDGLTGKAKTIYSKDYDEKRSTGRVDFKVYSVYLKSFMGYFGPVICMVLFAAVQILVMSADYCAISW